MLPTDWAAPASSVLRRLSDGRVQQYWDPNHLLATQMKKDARSPQPEQDCCTRSGILWDLAAVYPAGAVWSDRMPTATLFNGPVVDVTDGIEAALTRGLAIGYGLDCAPIVGSEYERACVSDTRRLRKHDGHASKPRRGIESARPRCSLRGGRSRTLAESDVRRGYPRPTLLYADRDIFGMSVPKRPLPAPT